MNKQAKHYENTGDKLTNNKSKLRAYKAAENALFNNCRNTAEEWEALKRINAKALKACELLYNSEDSQ